MSCNIRYPAGEYPEGEIPEKVLTAVNIGNGCCTYALVHGVWYSVNMGEGGKIQDVRWKGTRLEKEILDRRMGW